MPRRRLPLLTVCLCFAALAAHARSEDTYKHAREQFLQAYSQAATIGGEPQKPDSEELRNYPLYPYLQAARIKRALLEATISPTASLESVDQRAQTFATYYEQEPVGRDLRRTWLASLAERQQWTTFLDQYRDQIADLNLQCMSFTARIELDRTAGLDEEIAAAWLTPRTLPECERAFDWLRERNALPPDLVQQRARRALEDGNLDFAKQIVAMLPPDRTAPYRLWIALVENPRKQIDTLIGSPEQAILDDALLAGWSRLCRVNRDDAIARYDALVRSRKMDPATAGPYALALALALAWDRRPEALTYFKQVSPPTLDDYALEWQTRAAMWAEDWNLVARSIASMSDDQRLLARWRYWAARAADENDDPSLARQLYESVLIDDNFYSAMAAARLERTIEPHPEKLPKDTVQLRQIQELPEFVRARELLLSDMRNAAQVEWLDGYDTLSEQARTQAVHLAVRWGWYDQAIATATQQRIFNDYELLYPRPYDREVRAASKLSGLKPELIYGVMRQESLYRSDAVSSAGARGLLQMLPETARRTAKTWKRPRPKPDDLFDPELSVPLGAAHLRTLIDQFDGQVVVALAGYNAGPRAAARWLPDNSIEPDVWIENVPYNETRNYVQRILWHSIVFAWLRTGDPQRTDSWLARVAPLNEEPMLGSR
jgi:soluble lytic murein transglycosylase